jgi:transposase-like protein
MGIGKLEQERIVKGLIEGETISGIAREVGVDRGTVYRVTKSSEFRKYLQGYQKSFIEENLPKADAVYKKILDKKGDDDKTLKIQLEASRDVMHASGVVPSATQSTYVQQIFAQQNQLTLSPMMMAMLKGHQKEIGDYMDVEEVKDEE